MHAVKLVVSLVYRGKGKLVSAVLQLNFLRSESDEVILKSAKKFNFHNEVIKNSQQELIPPQHGSESSQSPTHSPSSQVMVDGNVDDSTGFINGDDDDNIVKMELTNNEDQEDDGSTSPSTRSTKGGIGFQPSPSHHQGQNQPLFPPMMSGPPPLLG